MALATSDSIETIFELPNHGFPRPSAAGSRAVDGPDDPLEDDTEADDSDDAGVVVPQVDESERARIRRSNDQDQAREREGETAPHNEGYDEAAKGGNRGT